MTTPAPPANRTEERVLRLNGLMLEPSLVRLILSFLNQADRGSPWWFFAGLANFVGLRALGAALLVPVVLAALRRISQAVLLLAIIQESLACWPGLLQN